MRTLGIVTTWCAALACLAPAYANPQPDRIAVTAAPAAAPASFAGEWESTFGPLTMTQAGAEVTGEYAIGDRPATLKGAVKERRLEFTYTEHNAKGEGWFELSADGRSFAGKWRESGSQQWGEWTGKAKPPLSFDGLWTTSYGPMRLRVRDTACEGVYNHAGISRITGAITNRRFSFTYNQPDGERGEGWYELSEDAMSFRGEWKTAGMSQPGSWSGTRVKPEKRTVWLVVLEAHWEGSLREREYSYGEMQRAFFKRLPHVNFRHRFVHDLADVQEFCGELAFIAEPVILYFSSHGTPNGISVGSGTVTPEQIASALHGAGNIMLMHFGACEVMRGDAPKRLLEAMPPGIRFPISGFANTADWAGSAIIDFTYLDLILEYAMTPAAAAEETRKSLRFADKGEPGVIPVSLLRIYELPEAR